MRRNIYLASSWRNQYQYEVLHTLLGVGHAVYDFRNPEPGNTGLAWSEIDGGWEGWNTNQFRAALTSDIAERGFAFDREAMEWADTCVCLLPCGKSAHLEAGWMAGQHKEVFFYVPPAVKIEPELMYLLGNGVFGDIRGLMRRLEHPLAPIPNDIP